MNKGNMNGGVHKETGWYLLLYRYEGRRVM